MTLSSTKSARLGRLIDVAQSVFLAQGYRGATMEGIAEAAGLSKVTLYGYFRDKEAAFDAVLSRFVDRLQAETLAALDAPGTVCNRVTYALVTKHGIVADVVRSSPFASELLVARRGDTDRVARLDALIVARLGEATGDARLGHILFTCAQALAESATSREEMSRDVARVVAALLPDGPEDP